jgi:hypothetical protein
MAIVSYNILGGAAPFTAELTPSLIPVNTHMTTGTFEFVDVPNGSYTLIIKDSNDCIFEQQITVDPLVTTTTTTALQGSSIVIGNTQDESLIFNVNGTNRDAHYEGFPNPNTSIIYLWLKTLDGSPLTYNRVVNYTFTANSGSTFKFNSLSDEIHVDVIQSVVGPATAINGQLYLKAGFIETYFEYVYNKNTVTPNFQIDLNSTGNWLYKNVPLTGGTNVYGVTYVDDDNIIMNF